MSEEVFKPIETYEDLYEISNLGRIRSFARVSSIGRGNTIVRKERFIKTETFHPSGYRFVTLIRDKKRKSCAVHRLVAQAFIENPNNLPQVNHIDTIKHNNIASNLEWCDNEYNQRHAVANGLVNHLRGENHPKAKITKNTVFKIRKLYKTGKYTFREVGAMCGVTKGHAKLVIYRKCWGHI